MAIIIKGRTIFGPNIVKDGLVLYLDAANTKSYSGSGTTWYDLSGNNVNGTLNGPTFNNKTFEFNGIDNTISISNPINQNNLEQEWTVSSYINISDKVSQCLLSINNGLYVCYVQGNNSLLYLNGGANDYYTYGGDLGNIGWVMATFRFRNSDGYRKIYKNDIDISTSGPNKTSTPSGNGAKSLIIGSGLEGFMSNFLIYNRLLTDKEITQNYNAIKKRFLNGSTYKT